MGGNNKMNPDQTQLYKRVGANIAHYRNKLGYSQDDLAGIIQVTRVTMNHIERGVQKITLDRLIDIADALKVEYIRLTHENHYVERVIKKSCANCLHWESEIGLCGYLDRIVERDFMCKKFLKRD